MAKTKPLLPSLREKKRYLAYEIISSHKYNDAIEINKAIFDASKEFLGNFGMSKAGILPLNDQWNPKLQRGVLRVNNKHIDELRSSLIFVNNIEGHTALIKSVGSSGILKKTLKRYLN